jgi:hypothetical protein
MNENFDDLSLLFPIINIHTYESINKLDNKTTSLFIPDGIKCFSWFTKYNNNSICLILEKNNKINDTDNEYKTTFHYASFSDELTKGNGTIVYGTLVDKSFYCETLYYFKGLTITGTSIDKFIILKNLFSYIYFSKFSDTLHFYLPYMANSKFIFEATNLPYSVSNILQFQNNKIKSFNLNELIGCFKILKRNEYEDVYELWILNNEGCYSFYSTALVNDLKTSNFLKNDIFNLDIDYRNSQFLNDNILEEIEWKFSKNDFFVGCIYISEFRKWKPIIKKNNADNIKSIQNTEKKIFSYIK